jgi:hypothetical protein
MDKMEASRQWSANYVAKGAGVARVSFDVYIGERMIRTVGMELIDMCVPALTDASRARNERMKNHLKAYLALISELNKPYLDAGGGDKIFKLQHTYYDEGIEMWGRAFIGNYAHVVGAGHVLWYMENGFYLKLYEQQSVEAKVKRLRAISYNNVARRARANSGRQARLL